MEKFLYGLIFPLIFLNCGGKSEGNKKVKSTKAEYAEIEINSPAFKEGEIIPIKYTCDGENISPEIKFGEVPSGVKSLALICDDPDAPAKTWVHWVIFNIPPDLEKLPEGIEPEKTLENGANQGINDSRNIGYCGPCPPSGSAHHYHFKIYGLDEKIDAPPGITKKELLNKMEGHIKAKGELIGLYKR